MYLSNMYLFCKFWHMYTTLEHFLSFRYRIEILLVFVNRKGALDFFIPYQMASNSFLWFVLVPSTKCLICKKRKLEKLEPEVRKILNFSCLVI